MGWRTGLEVRGGPTSVARAGEGGGNVLIGTETAGKMEGEKETWVLGGVLTNLLMFLFPSFFFFVHGMERASEWSTSGHVRNAFCAEIYSEENHRVIACGMFCFDILVRIVMIRHSWKHYPSFSTAYFPYHTTKQPRYSITIYNRYYPNSRNQDANLLPSPHPRPNILVHLPARLLHRHRPNSRLAHQPLTKGPPILHLPRPHLFSRGLPRRDGLRLRNDRPRVRERPGDGHVRVLLGLAAHPPAVLSRPGGGGRTSRIRRIDGRAFQRRRRQQQRWWRW